MIADGSCRQQALRKWNDVFGALSQWGNIQGDNIEPIEEGFPKAASRNLRRKIAIRSRDNARIDVYCVPAPNPLETLFLNESQKFSLKRRAQVSNFIEKYCAAIGGFEAAWFVFNGPREGALDMTKQLALEQLLGQCGAVDD